MRTVRLYLVGAAVCLLLAGAFIMSPFSTLSPAKPSSAARLPNGNGTPGPAGQPQPPADTGGDRQPPFKSDAEAGIPDRHSGVPAIKPRLFSPGVPAFTAEDVREYARRHERGFGKIGVSSGVPEVFDVQFLPAGTVHQLLGNSNLNLPVDALVCYVQYRGDFAVAGPPGLAPKHFTRVIQIFDAQTGNSLMLRADNNLR